MPKYKLEIENYLTIENHILDFTPGAEGFVGKNAQGKTNFLKAIQALCDTKNDPSKIRDGADKYTIRLNVYNKDGQVVAYIARVQTKEKIQLKSKGLPVNTTPAAFLASILDANMLNPLKLIQENPVAYLKKHLPSKIEDKDILDGFKKMESGIQEKNGFSFCEQAAKHISAVRVDIGRRMKQSQGSLAELKVGMPDKLGKAPHDTEEVKSDIAEIQGKISQIQVLNRQKKDMVVDLNRKAQEKGQIKNKYEDSKDLVTSIEQQIATKKQQIAAIHGTMEQLALQQSKANTEYDELEKKISEFKVPDFDELTEKIDAKNAQLREVNSWEHVQQRFGVVETKQKEVKDLEKDYEAKDVMYKYFAYDLPKALIRRCELPVEGLSFKGDQLFVGDRRIDLLSESEKAIVATKLAVALAKQKGQIAISLDGVEMMDKESRKAFLEVAKTSDVKIFYTRLGSPEGENEFEVIEGKVQNKEE